MSPIGPCFLNSTLVCIGILMSIHNSCYTECFAYTDIRKCTGTNQSHHMDTPYPVKCLTSGHVYFPHAYAGDFLALLALAR
jgi:hypothetical protein